MEARLGTGVTCLGPAAAGPGDEAECTLCFGAVAIGAEGEGVVLYPCGHVLCAGCVMDAMVHFVNASSHRQIKCMGAAGGCTATLAAAHSQIEALAVARPDLDAWSLLAKYTRALVVRELAASARFVWCAGPGCGSGAVIDAGPECESSAPFFMDCAECGAQTCTGCEQHADMHRQPLWRVALQWIGRGGPRGACPMSAASDVESEAWIRANAIACPSCGVALRLPRRGLL
ncbi:uncharacterized protein AMSG_08613 [Thecamonas trahens ATCC 50062]|uniref:RING-type domain-containing protein n=1 Tax=Thecamonas trahens ATCC 50062 TaxID=461836 RepID=A0A0L0DKJ0_THETB|nr:hypothetical protein AMSG_08613 [Thecamonas trahens ATCC 50062]KNC52735.1 hypothetical protein AMSG_08613 [Thecamonas trahens ATCC 50062]|eukprot:XP_013755049.1 hypothetical protein AMSG_08613 [Thecamonas trahens ATCC 50062]